MAEKLIAYGVRCVWWDSIDKVAVLNLPCCPFCKSVLFQEDEQKWWNGIDRYEREGHPGYRKMMEWGRGRCYPTMEALQQAFESRT